MAFLSRHVVAHPKRRRMRFFYVAGEAVDEEASENKVNQEDIGSNRRSSKLQQAVAAAALEKEKENVNAEQETTPATKKRQSKKEKSNAKAPPKALEVNTPANTPAPAALACNRRHHDPPVTNDVASA
eukprot:5577430-Pleurochrysis_carterae.AAC.1